MKTNSRGLLMAGAVIATIIYFSVMKMDIVFVMKVLGTIVLTVIVVAWLAVLVYGFWAMVSQLVDHLMCRLSKEAKK